MSLIDIISRMVQEAKPSIVNYLIAQHLHNEEIETSLQEQGYVLEQELLHSTGELVEALTRQTPHFVSFKPGRKRVESTGV